MNAPTRPDDLLDRVCERLRLESRAEALDVVGRVVSLLATQIVRGFADDAQSDEAIHRLSATLPSELRGCVDGAEGTPYPLHIAHAHQRLASAWDVPLDIARGRCNAIVELLAQRLDEEDWLQLREQLNAPWRDYLERLRAPLGTELGERGAPPSPHARSPL